MAKQPSDFTGSLIPTHWAASTALATSTNEVSVSNDTCHALYKSVVIDIKDQRMPLQSHSVSM